MKTEVSRLHWLFFFFCFKNITSALLQGFNCIENLLFSFCNRALTDISLLAVFIHLRYIDVSKNNLRDISALSALTHLLVIKADHNKLTSAALEELPYLQVASFNNNRFKTTEGLNHPQLEHLCLNCVYILIFKNLFKKH